MEGTACVQVGENLGSTNMIIYAGALRVECKMMNTYLSPLNAIVVKTSKGLGDRPRSRCATEHKYNGILSVREGPQR